MSPATTVWRFFEPTADIRVLALEDSRDGKYRGCAPSARIGGGSRAQYLFKLQHKP
jgi:hypothetical protein